MPGHVSFIDKVACFKITVRTNSAKNSIAVSRKTKEDLSFVEVTNLSAKIICQMLTQISPPNFQAFQVSTNGQGKNEVKKGTILTIK